ncbi:MAG: AraC family transcriptional regulator [Peptococcaceae bacterium]|nr:AraC family transcriptional regulator [Peptococcaceae bacterium]
MLAEYLQRHVNAMWQHPIKGVRLCRFSGTMGSTTQALAPVLAPLHFEAFFCHSGQLHLQRTHDHLRIQAREILLLSDVSAITGACLTGNLSGILVAVDAHQAQDSLQTLCALTGGQPLDTAAVARRMHACKGSAVIGASPWTNSAFDTLATLNADDQGRYILWKALELLYLLSCRDLFAETAPAAHTDNALAPLLEEMTVYMRQHLSDKLTIEALSTRFGLSQTVLKKAFRHCYGQPIHAWLQEQRLTRAACLLRESPMTVLEIAHEVGYSSTSQFSSAFVRRYGATPGQYRRKSV